MKKICKYKDFCGIVMPAEKNKILKFNQYMKSDKMSYIIYADLESLIKNIDRYENNTENSSTTKIGENILCGLKVFLVDIQCQQFGDLIIQKTSRLYIAEKTV